MSYTLICETKVGQMFSLDFPYDIASALSTVNPETFTCLKCSQILGVVHVHKRFMSLNH